jgi:DNA-binding MarR family transcriptional regulator
MKPPRNEAELLADGVGQQCIARRVRRLSRQITRIYDDAMRPIGLTVAQFGMLSAMIRVGVTSPAAVGRMLDLEKSTVSRNLARMVEHGWVSSEAGLRGVELKVLPAGRRMFERAHPAWESAQTEAAELMKTEAKAR